MNKEKIIRKSETYSAIINKNKSYKNQYFSIYIDESNEDNKYGITVPTKVGKAHIRNKLKRQIKNIIVKNEKSLPKKYNYVIIIKEAAKNLTYDNMINEFFSLIKKVGK